MVGIGGTGVVTANRLLGTVALKEGWSVSGLDQTGLSQKGGSVVSHLRASRRGAPAVNTVGAGGADVYFAFDGLAAAEPRHLRRASSARTVAMVSARVVPTIDVITSPFTEMPSSSVLEQEIGAAMKRTVSLDAEAVCEQLLGDPMPSNVFMAGASFQEGLLPFALETFEEAIGEMGRGAATNLEAFRWGRAAVAAPQALQSALAAGGWSRPAERQPTRRATRDAQRLIGSRPPVPGAGGSIEWFAADLVDYQDRAYARRFLDVVGRVAAADTRLGRSELSETAAHHLYRLMAYKDEYEVARLHLDPAFAAQISAVFPGAAASVRLHPPMLRALGMERKLAIPTSVSEPLFKTLRAARRLRGTRLDVFGYADVRRVERRLVDEYVATLDRVLAVLSQDNYSLAVELAAAPEVIRGYEEIKLRRVEQYEINRRQLLERLDERR